MSSEVPFDEKRMKKLDRELQAVINREGIDRKTLDEVFDKATLLTLGKLISDQVIDVLDFPISTGKEANIFRALTPSKKYVAIKIYCTSNLTFKHIAKYIVGDPRFTYTNKSRREVISEWAKKEFKNLERLKEAQVRAPTPIKRISNVLVMEYIGTSDQPAPLLKDTTVTDPEHLFTVLIDFITRMYHNAGLVHADLSAYNILIHQQKPYLIDLGQGVLLEHPLAHEFLKRDVHNIVRYFQRLDIKADEEQIIKKIMKKK